MKRRTPSIVVLGVLLLLAACGGSDTATEARIETVGAERAAEVMAEAPDGLVILDIRTPEEFAAGHIDGAVNIDYYAPDFRDSLDALDKDVPYVMYCRSGNRSSDARTIMADLEFTEVYELDGGVVAWNQAGYPLAR
jgi:rhodanese-related sulfurtransferase